MAEEENRGEPTVLPENEGGSEGGSGSRFPDLEDLQQEIDRRIRENRRFLEKFMDEDFEDEENEEEDEREEFEEL